MQPAQLFGQSSALIEQVVAAVCRRAHLDGADAEDFAGDVRLALIDDDYAVLRGFEGRSSLYAFLSVVIERMLFDQRTRTLGRWTPSAQAKRLGPAAILIEKLLHRDRRSIDEALPVIRAAYPAMSRAEVGAIEAQLPERIVRPRPVALDEVVEQTVPAPHRADERTLARESHDVAERTGAVMRRALDELTVEDRMIIRFRFANGMSIADISRMTRLPQRPLYRRIESLLERLRRALAAAGVDADAIAALIGSATEEIDFGFGETENGAAIQSISNDSPAAGEETR